MFPTFHLNLSSRNSAERRNFLELKMLIHKNVVSKDFYKSCFLPTYSKRCVASRQRAVICHILVRSSEIPTEKTKNGGVELSFPNFGCFRAALKGASSTSN